MPARNTADTSATRDAPPNRTILLNDYDGNAKANFLPNTLTTTKYTLLNLLPRAIFEQFRRLSNFYFLLISMVSYIPGISPTNPITNILPLAVVVGFGFSRDVYEDTVRRVSDRRSNSEPCLILTRTQPSRSPGIHLQHVATSSLCIGDIVSVSKDTIFPADLVLLNTSNPDGVCYVSTANLDGETSLKRMAVPHHLKGLPPAELFSIRGEIQCIAPEPDLYQFQGSLILDNQDAVSLDSTNILLRGSVLRNTENVFGIAVYTGFESKVALNMRHPPSKLSRLERKLNFVVLAIFGFLILNIIVCAACSAIWHSSFAARNWYIDTTDTSRAPLDVFFRGLGTFFILLGSYIPVSLFVTLEFVHIYQGMYMSWDTKMYAREMSVSARSTNLNEMLGCIHHIFTDKTGTLTENVMKFVACSVAGEVYDIRTHPDCMKNSVEQNNQSVKSLVRAMAVCHTVVPEVEADHSEQAQSDHSDHRKSGSVKRKVYQGQSPDEVALVESARNIGAELVERGLSSYSINEFGELKTYNVLAELQFNSDRKRMSIIARGGDGTITLYCKGADSIMLPLLESCSIPSGLQETINAFAAEGLRTLVFSARVLDQNVFDAWFARYQIASNSLEDRKVKVAELSVEIEQGMQFIGSTAVEDKLQPEVPATIQFLRQAGIRLWVLTGDKRETAENIGYASQLLDGSMKVIHVQGNSVDEVRECLKEASSHETVILNPESRAPTLVEKFQTAFGLEKKPSRGPSSEKDFALIIDGPSLRIALDSLGEEFLAVADDCKTVICCRVTPLQKALVVQLVQTFRGANTLAIGDGGNDVSMIREADVGVGVHGKEGSQAVLAADYTIGEFRVLRRLMSVHGRYSYVRTSGLINLSFYKNFTFTLLHFLFQLFNGFSGTTIHNEWYVTFYNLGITVLAPFAYALFERDLREETLEKFPQSYGFNRDKVLFGFRTALEYLLGYGGWHAVVVFFMVRWGLGFDSVRTDGEGGGYAVFSLAVSTSIVFVVLFKFILASRQIMSPMVFSVVFGLGVQFCVPLIVSRSLSPPLYGVQFQLLGTWYFWLLLVATLVVCLLADVSVAILRSLYSSNILHDLQEYEDEVHRNSSNLSGGR